MRPVCGNMCSVGIMSEVEIVAVNNFSETRSINSQAVRVATFYFRKCSHYFEVVDEGDKNLKAHCTLCSASAKPIFVQGTPLPILRNT